MDKEEIADSVTNWMPLQVDSLKMLFETPMPKEIFKLFSGIDKEKETSSEIN